MKLKKKVIEIYYKFLRWQKIAHSVKYALADLQEPHMYFPFEQVSLKFVLMKAI